MFVSYYDSSIWQVLLLASSLPFWVALGFWNLCGCSFSHLTEKLTACSNFNYLPQTIRQSERLSHAARNHFVSSFCKFVFHFTDNRKSNKWTLMYWLQWNHWSWGRGWMLERPGAAWIIKLELWVSRRSRNLRRTLRWESNIILTQTDNITF